MTIITTTETRVGPPLEVLPDMASTWRNGDWDFDTAADLLIESHRDNGPPRDLPVTDLRTWKVREIGGHLALQSRTGNHRPCRLRAGSLADLSQRLGAPAEFVRDRLPGPLQLATLNWLLAQAPKPLTGTLRLRNNEVTALVGQRYAPLDAVELVETVRDSLVRHDLLSQVRVRSIASGTTDLLRLTFPARSQAVRVGDVTATGIDISTSSFARSAIHVRGMLWRLVCTNGLRTAQSAGSFSFRHVGEPQRLKEGLATAIPAVLTHLGTLMDQWFSSVDRAIPDVSAEIDALKGLTLPEQARVRAAVTKEAEAGVLPRRVNVYDLVNAITGAAHSSTPGRRLEIEAIAGGLLQRHVN